MKNGKRLIKLAERIESNYYEIYTLKNIFKKRSPLSFGKKELRYSLPAINRRLNKLKREYERLAGVGYYRGPDVISGIDKIRKKYCD